MNHSSLSLSLARSRFFFCFTHTNTNTFETFYTWNIILVIWRLWSWDHTLIFWSRHDVTIWMHFALHVTTRNVLDHKIIFHTHCSVKCTLLKTCVFFCIRKNKCKTTNRYVKRGRNGGSNVRKFEILIWNILMIHLPYREWLASRFLVGDRYRYFRFNFKKRFEELFVRRAC